MGPGSLPETGDDANGLLASRGAQRVLGLLLHQKLQIPGEGCLSTYLGLSPDTKFPSRLKAWVPSTHIHIYNLNVILIYVFWRKLFKLWHFIISFKRITRSLCHI